MVGKFLDLGATIIVMPKKVSDIIGLIFTRCATRVLQLNGINVKNLRVVKDIPMKLHKCPNISIIQDIIVSGSPSHV